MTPRPSAPTAARCLRGCAGGCRRRISSRERDGRIVGLLLGRDGRSASQLGPLIAEDDDVAQALLARALSRISGTVYVDFADASRAFARWLEACGFAAQRPFTRMLLGRAAGFDDVARTFAVIGRSSGDASR